LNLDSNISDFLFWMVHELGHVISPTLHDNTDLSEDFADEFAQALLFPKECAKRAYKEITEAKATTQKVSIIQRLAKKHAISPITVYRSINAYAGSHH
jgi:Zn-dependent peptidase ImmA (M78 family)